MPRIAEHHEPQLRVERMLIEPGAKVEIKPDGRRPFESFEIRSLLVVPPSGWKVNPEPVGMLFLSVKEKTVFSAPVGWLMAEYAAWQNGLAPIVHQHNVPVYGEAHLHYQGGLPGDRLVHVDVGCIVWKSNRPEGW